ncbi:MULTISPECIES: hypothetical protein [Halorussus]|uniref:hypothetical protein n=1 Tax=Halorussus TaxID=1070314 RepID=UPI000E20EAF3|nr:MULTISPECIES: hypothetical protein [Halorussus]NHN59932.1 hypothetical protein [Halorussus sp. JP-T4]
MRRRTLLALTGSSIAGLAGCLGGTRSDGTAGTTADATMGTTGGSGGTTERSGATTTTANADVSVALDALQPGLVSMNSPDSIGVHPTDGQYLLLEVAAEGPAPPAADDFAFRLGETTRPPVTEQQWRIWRFYGEKDWRYDADSGEGLLLFELPESAHDGESAAAALAWPGGEWRPDEALRRRLATPEPPLSVSVEIPEEVPVTDHPTVSVSVTNDGDVPGRFVAGLNRSGPMVAHTPVSQVSVLVPAGETETWELDDDSIMGGYQDERVGDGDPDMTYYLVWGDDRAEREVRYVQTPASTTDTA